MGRKGVGTSRASARRPRRMSESVYSAGLHDLWGRRTQTAVEHVTSVLSENPQHDFAPALYRLWIEILAESGDQGALRAVGDHLHRMAHEQPRRVYPTYLALLGLVHLELEEVEGARLIARSLRPWRKGLYVAELEHRLRWRVGTPRSTNLMQSVHEVRDYFQLETILRAAWTLRSSKRVDQVLARIRRLYPDAPLPQLVALHEAMERNDYKGALVPARALTEAWPSNQEFAFYRAVATFYAGDTEHAKDLLLRVGSLSGEIDADLASLLGECYLDMSARSERGPGDARYYFQKAMAGRRALGLPLRDLERRLAKATEGDAETADRPMSRRRHEAAFAKSWMVRLSSQSFYQFRTASEATLRQIRHPLGMMPQPGDTCFLAYPDPGTRGQRERYWRIAAVYRVDSQPSYDPIAGVVTDLVLEHRPDRSIPIDVSEVGGANRRHTNPRSGYSSHVYELNAEGVQRIADALEDRYGLAAKSLDDRKSTPVTLLRRSS